MDLRAYLPADRDACLALFDSHGPAQFAPQEREAFARFLEQPEGEFFLAEHEGQPVACGGYEVVSPDHARLRWTLVRGNFIRKGIGRFLVFALLHQLTRKHNPRTVSLETTQLAAGFFERQGFHRAAHEPDGFAPGLDRIRMQKKLQVCS